MAPKNPLREGEKPQEPSPGKSILGTRNQEKKRLVLPDGRVIEFVIKENSSKIGDDDVYEESETSPTVFDEIGNLMDLNSGFLRLSHTGVLITSPEQWAQCTSLFHRRPNRNISVGVDGSSFGNGQGICMECQRVLNTIYIVLAIFGIGVLIGLFRTFTILF